MLRSLIGFFALTLSAADYGCSNFAQLSHTSSGCPANQGNPDCSFIQANAQQFCSTVATSWEIINGPNCNLRGASYGCVFATGLYSTTDQFCCPLIVVGGPAVSATATVTATTSITATPSASPSVTATATTTVTPSVTASTSAFITAKTTASPTPSITASSRVTPSAIASITSLPTASSSATAMSTTTSTGTFTAIPSTNITVVYVQTTNTSIQNGEAAAIGLSAIFGFLVLCGCCGLACRRQPAKPDEIVRQVTISERRKSVVEEKERRKSTLEIRTIQN